MGVSLRRRPLLVVAIVTDAIHNSPMTTAAVKEQIDAMSDDDRFFAAAYLQHLANEGDEQRKARLDARMKRMDEGRKISQEQLLELHAQLEAQGL